MEVESFDKTIERRILIGMITDTTMVSAVAAIGNSSNRSGLFKTDFANLIAKWCLQYYQQYGTAINGEIKSYYQTHHDKYPNDSRVLLIGDLLTSLDFESDHQPIQNREYLIDQASHYFTSVRLEKLADHIKTGIQSGNFDDSLEALNAFSRVELGADMGINPLRDETAIRLAFESTGERLITFWDQGLDDASVFFGDTFCRDSLVGFLASEKSGKSFFLLDMVVRAIKQGRRVAYFEVGDLSQSQVMMRLMQRILQKPKRKGLIKVPERIEFDKKFNPEVSFHNRQVDDPLSADTAVKRLAKFGSWLEREYGEDVYGLLRLSCHPSDSISVVGIESRLDTWERTGWIPDIVVIDYADILAPMDARKEKRYQVDDTWKRLRGLSQKRHICVITASQADAASYRVKTLDKSNFSESKTKLAHVTAFIGINALPDEKEKQLRRLNFIVRREEAYSELDCLYVAGCLAIGSPMMISVLPNR